jgi:Leucine-rich repeat (LRR) protein
LGSLTKLEYLNLSSESFSLKKIPEAIGNFLKLKYLNLSSSMGSGVNFFDNWRSKDSVNFFTSPKEKVDSFISSISTLFNLEHLDLSNNDCITYIPGSICNLRKLNTLNLSYCSPLMIAKSIGTMESLKTLYTVGCSYLELPQFSSNLLSLPHFLVHAGERSSNLVVLQHTNPAELEIVRLENVKSAEEAQSIELIGKHSMNKLELQWTRYAERSVDDKLLLEKLVPPSTVREFRIHGYNSVSFPAWLMDITHYLPNLTTVNLWYMPNCKVLPPMEKLPNLHSLVLVDMASLEEWNMSVSGGQECVISFLKIHDCPKLRIKPLPPRLEHLVISKSDSVLSSWGEYTGASTTSSYPVKTALTVEQNKVPMHQWRLLQHLPGLTLLDITNSGDLTGSPEVIQHLSSLPSLRLCQFEEIPKWVGELTSLRLLQLSWYSGLRELPENMRQLTELHSLGLTSCYNIASLPYWLGELTSLKKLTIRNCDLIRSLPEGIQQLTNLQELEISCCPALKTWCELEENMTKLAHIQDKVYVHTLSHANLIL